MVRLYHPWVFTEKTPSQQQIRDPCTYLQERPTGGPVTKVICSPEEGMWYPNNSSGSQMFKVSF